MLRRWGMPVSISLQSDNLDQLQLAKSKLKDELRRYKELKDVIDAIPITSIIAITTTKTCNK